MTGPSIETFRLGDAGPTSFEALRRGFQTNVETREAGAETIFTTLGEYALQQPPGERWQFTPPQQWRAAQGRHHTQPVYRQDWATAEELRTRASEDAFAPQQMDALEESLVQEHRVTNAASKLTIATEDELLELLNDHHIPLDRWRPTGIHDLYMYIRPGDQPRIDNVSLHEVNNELWLASAQTMLANVYYTEVDAAGNSITHRLQETEKRYYTNTGTLGPPARLTMRSSLGETAQLINGVPERPFDAAYRCLLEEIGTSREDVLQIFSIASLLRQSRQGHYRFKGIKAEDHTHYFNAWLKSETVRPKGYTCIETDPEGKRRVRIKLGWLEVERA